MQFGNLKFFHLSACGQSIGIKCRRVAKRGENSIITLLVGCMDTYMYLRLQHSQVVKNLQPWGAPRQINETLQSMQAFNLSPFLLSANYAVSDKSSRMRAILWRWLGLCSKVDDVFFYCHLRQQELVSAVSTKGVIFEGFTETQTDQ